jgi:hypothetical protein
MTKVRFGENVYCGPAVISAICEITTDDAARYINYYRGKSSDSKVTGANLSELKWVLSHLDYETEDKPKLANMSLYRFLLSVKEEAYYIVCVPGHFIIAELRDGKRYICDNHTKQEINAGASARLSQPVVQVLKVTKRIPIYIPEYLPVVNGHWMNI